MLKSSPPTSPSWSTSGPNGAAPASRSPLTSSAEELGDKVKVVKLNIDDNPMTAGRFGVRGLPTFMIFEKGNVTATQSTP